MGYTHYWHRKQNLDAKKFRAAVADCKKICDALPIPLGDGHGQGEPDFDADCVCFNGSVDSGSFSRDAGSIPWPAKKAEGVAVAGTDARAGSWWAGSLLRARAVDEGGDGSYETFCVERDYTPQSWDSTDKKGRYFECCKTGYRPYDLLAQCCLIVFNEHFGDDFGVRSDGEDEQWNEARDGCQIILGYGLLFALDPRDD
jgi:hypothetical protein